MSNGTFDLNAFIQESKEVLVNPKSYFSTMKTSGGMTEPLIKAVIYGAVAGAISFIWSLLHFTIGAGGVFGGIMGIGLFFTYTIGAVIGLFIGAIILLVISSICKGSTDFETNVRVVAAVMVLMPISALLGFTTHLNLYLGSIISIGVSIFYLWLLYNALIECLKSKPETTKILMYVLAALIVIFSLVALRKTSQIMKEFNSSNYMEMIDQQK
jgi:hypothetical protein